MREDWGHKALAIGPDVGPERDVHKDLAAIVLVRNASLRANPKVSSQGIESADDIIPVKQPCIDPEEIVPYVKLVLREINRRPGRVDIFLWEVRRDAVVFIFLQRL